MDIQKLINQLKARVEKLAKKAQAVFKVSANTGEQALTVVTDNAQALAQTQTSAAKDLVEVAKATFEKAREAGLKEVATKPVDFLPVEGKDLVLAAAEETVDVLTKTSKELTAVFKRGYNSILVKIGAKKAPARKAVRRTVRKAKKVAAAA